MTLDHDVFLHTLRVVLFSFWTLVLLSPAAFAADETVTLPIADYKAILQQLNALQKRVEFLETRQPTAGSAPAPAAVPVTVEKKPAVVEEHYEALSADVNEIYGIVDDLETRVAQNRVNLGAELRTRVDYYKAENYNYADMTEFVNNVRAGVPYFEAGINAYRHEEERKDYNNWSSRFRITMDAKVTDSIHFHGRLSGGGYWGDADSGDAFFFFF